MYIIKNTFKNIYEIDCSALHTNAQTYTTYNHHTINERTYNIKYLKERYRNESALKITIYRAFIMSRYIYKQKKRTIYRQQKLDKNYRKCY
jgi:hypothetical protein